MEILFKCKKCGEKNNISNINGTCGNCDNSRLENFGITITRGKLRGMSGMHTLSTAKEILKSALDKEKILLIDPQKHLFEDTQQPLGNIAVCNLFVVGRPGKSTKTHIIKESNFKPELAPKESNIERIQIDDTNLVVMSY